MTDLLAPVAALPGVPAAVASARASVDALLGHRVLRRQSAEVTAESALRGARASAELEGSGIELERLRGQLMAGGAVTLGARGAQGDRDEHGARVVEGAVRLHAGLGQVLVSWRHSPRQALARLHVLAAADLVGTEALGRPRSGQPTDDPLGLGPAPEPAELAARLDGLARVLVAGTQAPAVVVSAVVHGELLALQPFGSLDGLVARAAARLVLIDRGLDPKAVSAPEVGHVELRHDYAEAARAYVAGGANGVAHWVRHCAEAVGLGAREGLAVCEALRRQAS